MNPVDWWHALEGGRIAEQRPPPPNVDAAYPSLGSVPEIPSPTNAAARAGIASGLAADRANAQYTGPATPEDSSPRAAPPAAGRAEPAPVPPAPVPPAESDAASASLPAASAPPSAPPPPRPAPSGRVETAPPPPAPAGTAAATGDAAAAAAPLPTMPAAPPAAPRIAGVDVPVVTAPTPPPVAPPPAAPTVTPGGTAVLVPFPAGSTSLPIEAQDALRGLATRRGAAGVVVTGYGEAALDDPATQQAALPLALSRARAIAAVLAASGVPAASMRVDAQAEGRGGAARLVN